MTDWFQLNAQLRALAERQIFFVGGAPRSGTTWLQQIIDQHPQASCRGEGLFAKDFFPLFDDSMAKRRQSLENKNREVFSHTKGYPLPGAGDSRFLAATAMLLALHQQAEGKDCLAYGEKTPENVFAFPELKQLFPRAKLIAIIRDPRDLLTSAWHFFQKKKKSDDEAKFDFIRMALPSINHGMKVTLHLGQTDPASCRIVTYERLHQDPVPPMAAIFRFLGLDATDEIVAACLEATRFDKMTGGRQAGDSADGSFLRKGVVGDWRSTLSPAMNALILQELGWAFPHFGWVA
ncbi:sulfotransferase [Acidisoma cellulosilytica]|uniref:Sulfotransferase n=1 Tax=Acidisoma cellulosilyticum TaxID=2802395 RepID=A0A963Z1V8_9PROT|nr:sulfotransferase [Acidisoma cellulosilyticum]MCB8881004.1 sulfotransferase [Acidisoma cellulosilyticum]